VIVRFFFKISSAITIALATLPLSKAELQVAFFSEKSCALALKLIKNKAVKVNIKVFCKYLIMETQYKNVAKKVSFALLFQLHQTWFAQI
jgi:hypothetical protein